MRSLLPLVIFICLLDTACMRLKDFDDSPFEAPSVNGSADNSPPAADQNFANAKAVIDGKCLGCHSEWSNATANSFVSQGFVAPGNPAGSKLYYRLQGSTGGPGAPRNMPQGGSISTNEVGAIQTWIANLK